MPIVKSPGLTPTERFLATLCDQSFLRLWSYPNPYRDDGKELCDSLAVFDDRVFVFLDRESRALDDSTKDPLVSWNRWRKTAVDAQVRAAHGAERYVRSGRAIFLDRARAIPFPLTFDREKMTVHKIVVAHGAKEACQLSSYRNVYGSLAVSYGRYDDMSGSFPFMIHLDKTNPVHVFDSFNLPLVLSELDTVFDFSAYLEAKIDAINSLDCLTYCGEEDLLAHYFLNYDDSRKRHFIGTKRVDINFVAIGEGGWKDFVEGDLYKRKKRADEASYLWDELIQRTCQNALDGKLLGDTKLFEGRSAILEMAKEPRFVRRALSKKILQVIRGFPESSDPLMRQLTLMPSFHEGKAYVFLQLKVDGIVDYDKYRAKRQAMLEIACGAAKNKFEFLKTIIGIAIDAPKFSRRNSEDFLLMNCESWTGEQRAHYERANIGFDFFATSSMSQYKETVTEFPSADKE
jgi:hypothetical protein